MAQQLLLAQDQLALPLVQQVLLLLLQQLLTGHSCLRLLHALLLQPNLPQQLAEVAVPLVLLLRRDMPAQQSAPMSAS